MWLAVSSRAELSAEVLFLRKQLAFYKEHQVQPGKLTDAARFSLVLWSHLFDWRAALMIVKPETLIGWHRKGFKLFWRREVAVGKTADSGRALPADCAHGAGEPDLGRGAHCSRTVGEARDLGFAANGAGVLAAGSRSERRVENRLAALADVCSQSRPGHRGERFLGGDNGGIRRAVCVRGDGSGKSSHSAVQCHGPSDSNLDLQQFREAIPSNHTYRFLIHDRDTIFSAEVDDELGAFGLKALRTPVRAPKANAYCERLLGTIRRECLDYVIPLSEKHLRTILREWVVHYNQGRPHASLGPGVPDSGNRASPFRSIHRHELPADWRIRTQGVLGGLHHEYWLEEIAA